MDFLAPKTPRPPAVPVGYVCYVCTPSPPCQPTKIWHYTKDYFNMLARGFNGTVWPQPLLPMQDIFMLLQRVIKWKRLWLPWSDMVAAVEIYWWGNSTVAKRLSKYPKILVWKQNKRCNGRYRILICQTRLNQAGVHLKALPQPSRRITTALVTTTRSRWHQHWSRQIADPSQNQCNTRLANSPKPPTLREGGQIARESFLEYFH